MNNCLFSTPVERFLLSRKILLLLVQMLAEIANLLLVNLFVLKRQTHRRIQQLTCTSLSTELAASLK